MAGANMTGLVPEKYTPENQRFDDDPAIFTIRPLNGMEAMEMMAESTTGGVMRVAIKYGLEGWENCKNKDGDIIQFSTENLGYILPQTLSELAEKIIELTDLGESQVKN